MAEPASHERLSALDAAFLGVEDRCSHMHIGSVATFDATPLGPGGAIDPDRVRHLVEAALAMVPRYHQRVETVPLLGHPVWWTTRRST
jgi:hypothetical protein